MNRGFILLLVVALLSVIALTCISFFSYAQRNRYLSKNYLYKVRSDALAYSGIEYALYRSDSDFLFYSKENQSIPITIDQDIVHVYVQDANSRINVNDGVVAGALELSSGYNASALDPWPSIGPENKSALLNLRLRRLLNAYGDVYRFVKDVYDGDQANVVLSHYYGNGDRLPSQVFSVAADGSDGDRKTSLDPKINLNPGINYNNGLGDRIIENRPPSGYTDLFEIKDIVDAWAREKTIGIFSPDDHASSFFDLIKNDLTVSSYEDTEFFRIEDESVVGTYETLANFSVITPKDLQGDAPYFTNNYEGIFRPHSVALINLNQASFYVKASVFYAIVNLSLSGESSTTIAPYKSTTGNNYFYKSTAIESMSPRPSIGVSGVHLHTALADVENGVAGVGRKNHFMSLRDAINVAYWYEQYSDLSSDYFQKEIYNFNDFRDFLMWFIDEGNQDFIIAPFERALSVSRYKAIEDGKHFNAGGLFHVARHNQSNFFAKDYGPKILPHVLSCVRRMPGYLGAPIALTSPYLVWEPSPLEVSYGGNENGHDMRKIEDFVWRFTQPKVMFLPGGQKDVESLSVVQDGQGNVLSQSEIHASVQQFSTKYFRVQNNFIDGKDPLTHQDIKIGPEFLPDNKVYNFAPYIGVIGLNDFDQDVLYDPVINHQSGMNPQIVMNFDPEVSDDDESVQHGFFNTSQSDLAVWAMNTPIYNRITYDPWIDAIGGARVEGPAWPLEHCQMSGGREHLLPGHAQTSDVEGSCDLSPFNGLFLTSMVHGEFIGNDPQNGFNDSLYWRLDEDSLEGRNGWIKESDPSVKNLMSGFMVFWFRMPTSYDYVTQVAGDGNQNIKAESFSRVLVSLNVWEAYQYDFVADGDRFYRPVTLTVGLKKTKTKGQHVFLRYDTAGQSYTLDHTAFPYIAPTAMQTLIPSVAMQAPQEHYDYFGYLCREARVPETNTYQAYRTLAHKSAEVSALFDNVHEAGPGSWQRVGAAWNLRWPGEDVLSSQNQLWIRIFNHTTSRAPDEVNDYHEAYSYDSNPITTINSFNTGTNQNPAEFTFKYPGSDDLKDVTNGGRGFMGTFDSAMVLSLGEAHFRRLEGRGKYIPMWRFNSTIDNFRFYMGPSDPQASFPDRIDEAYLDPESGIYSDQLALSNMYGAMRYKVLSQEAHGEDHEPDFLFDPSIPEDATVFSIGTRVYYPPDTHDNYPYVELSSTNFRSEKLQHHANRVPDNEQTIFYDGKKASKNYRIRLQYKAHRPALYDNDISKRGPALEYVGYSTDGEKIGDHFTNLPWIKEISIRYKTPEEQKIFKWKVIH